MSNHKVWFLWAGQTMANLGDIFYLVALISFLYRATDSALYTSMVPIVAVCGQLISGIAAPLLFDRLDLKRILVISQSLKSVLLFVMTVYFQWFLGTAFVSYSFLFVFAIALLDGVATPSRNALLPRLVDELQLVKVNSLFSSTDQGVLFIGWAFGGVLVSFWSETNVLWATCGLYIASSLFLLPLPEESEGSTESKESTSKWESIRAGWEHIWNQPSLRTVILSEVIDGLAGGVWISAILLVYVKEALLQGAEWWGFLNASYFIGMILGGLIVYAIGNPIHSKAAISLTLSTLLAAIFTWGFGYTSWTWLALGLSVALGPVHQIQMITKQTIVQRMSDPEMLAKVFSARGTLQYVGFGVSVVMMSTVTDQLGVRFAYTFAALLIVVQLVYLIIKRRFLHSDQAVHHESGDGTL
ncbi:MFS transporter [Brevibacillus ginsengisoli]|uniref:MFS transporter n=1 Tax=Brevibacillus ginsengisoli TaxID=363854 RepID=UPI003CE7F992